MRSHALWFAADAAGRLKQGEELMALSVPQPRGSTVIMDRDECPRAELSAEKMARLGTVYGSPTVTAGNAPGLNAGASAVALMRRSRAYALGIRPLATIAACECAAGAPKYMACIPAQTIANMLARVGVALDQVDLLEINEAFAAVTLVSLKLLADRDSERMRALEERTNVNGGAIAIGHPVGASGARITMTLMYELMRSGGGTGVAAICGGLSQGEALLLKV